jgi:hypothetical protein
LYLYFYINKVCIIFELFIVEFIVIEIAVYVGIIVVNIEVITEEVNDFILFAPVAFC